MSQRKYRFEKMTPEQLIVLAEKYPSAVETITIRKPRYSIIAKLLDCDVEVPGVTLIQDTKPAEVSGAVTIGVLPDKPTRGRRNNQDSEK